MTDVEDFSDSGEFFESIDDYNNHLVECLYTIKLNEYIPKVHDMFYKDVDISFMEYFLSICDRKNEFIIDQEKLKEYNVITSGSSSKIKRALEQYGMIEGKDYLVDNVVQQKKRDENRGGSNKKQYMMTQKSFKICLIRSKNSYKYADYYILLEELIKHYIGYERAYNAKIISMNKKVILMKDDKIDTLIQETRQQSKKMDEQSKEIRELIKHTKHTNTELGNVTTELVTVNTELGNVTTELVTVNTELGNVTTELGNVNNQLVSVNNQLFTANVKIDNMQESINMLIVRTSNYSNLPIENDRSLRIVKMIRFIILDDDQTSEYVNGHVMYYSMENTMTRLKSKFQRYHLDNRNRVTLLGTTHPVNDSMNCVQQLIDLRDLVIANTGVNRAHVQLFTGMNHQRRILRVRRDIAQQVVDEFIHQINLANVINEVEELEQNVENNLNVQAFYNASLDLNTELIDRFKNNMINNFNIANRYRELIDISRDQEVERINADPNNDFQIRLE